jgi:hypothetical protein
MFRTEGKDDVVKLRLPVDTLQDERARHLIVSSNYPMPRTKPRAGGINWGKENTVKRSPSHSEMPSRLLGFLV